MSIKNKKNIGDYSTLKNDHFTFKYARYPVNANSIAVLQNITISCTVKTLKLYGFSLGVISIFNFNLCILKGNVNATGETTFLWTVEALLSFLLHVVQVRSFKSEGFVVNRGYVVW